MDGPILNYSPPPMPAAFQVESARQQLEGNRRPLEGSTWAIHPRDLAELTMIGDAVHLHGRWFTVAADPDLAGEGPRLIWPDEWPEEWPPHG